MSRSGWWWWRCHPAWCAAVVADALSAHPEAVVTDVGSVKAEPLRVLAGWSGRTRWPATSAGTRWPAASSPDPWAASGELFGGRAWAVTPHAGAAPAAVAAVESLARTCGADVVTLSPDEHDIAVARVSHLPHLLSVLTAAQLVDAPTGHLTLSGQGLRDVTRVAAGDPALWGEILAANAAGAAHPAARRTRRPRRVAGRARRYAGRRRSEGGSRTTRSAPC